MAVSRFRDWMEGDEIVRITFEDELQFGKILEQNIDRESFKVAWNSKSSPSPIFDDNYYPDDLREKMVIHKIFLFMLICVLIDGYDLHRFNFLTDGTTKERKLFTVRLGWLGKSFGPRFWPLYLSPSCGVLSNPSPWACWQFQRYVIDEMY